MTGETGSENGSEAWKKFLRKHWNALALFVVAVVLAAVGAVYVFLWFVGNAQSTGLVPTILGLWTMGNLVTFILYAIFWELLLIGVPAIIGVVVGWLWWRKLPREEKMEYHFFGRGSRATSGGGGVSIGLFVLFCIKVYIDGNWNVAIGTWTLDYVVYSVLWILIWILVIFGIPGAIAAVWWIRHEIKKKP
jgi:hypothetical protein